MNKKSLANKVTPGIKLNKKQAEFALSAIFERIRLFVKGDKKFKIQNFGEFYVERRKMQTMVDHNRKALVLLPPKDKIVFKFYTSEDLQKESKSLDDNLSNLIKEVTEELLAYHEFKRINFDETACYDFFMNLFDNLRDNLANEKNINIGEFGKFKAKNQTISFSPSKKFAEDINYNFSNLNSQVVRQLSKAEYSKYGITEQPEQKKEEKHKLKDHEPYEKPIEKEIPKITVPESIKEPTLTVKPLEEIKPTIQETEEIEKLKEEFIAKTKVVLEDDIIETKTVEPQKIEEKIPSTDISKIEIPKVEIPKVVEEPVIEKPIIAAPSLEPEIEKPIITKPSIEEAVKSLYEIDKTIEKPAEFPSIEKPIEPSTLQKPESILTFGESIGIAKEEKPHEEEKSIVDEDGSLSIGDIYSKLKKSFSVIEEDEEETEEENLSEEEKDKKEFLKRQKTFENKWKEHKLDDNSPVLKTSEVIEKPETIHSEEEIRNEYEEQRKKFEEELKRESLNFQSPPPIPFKFESSTPKVKPPEPQVQEYSSSQVPPLTEKVIISNELPDLKITKAEESSKTEVFATDGIDSIPINMDNSPIVFKDEVKPEIENGFGKSMNDYFVQKEQSPEYTPEPLPPIDYSSPVPEEQYFPRRQEEVIPQQPQKPSQYKILGIPVIVIVIFLLTIIIILGGYATLKYIEKKSKVTPTEEIIDTVKSNAPPVENTPDENSEE